MRQSQLFTKTRREAPKDEVSKNAQLLIRAGYIHKEMSGAYNFLPLALRVLRKIENIIREEMNALGGQEVFLASLQKEDNWKKTGRWDIEPEEDSPWIKAELKDGTKVGLAFTHEEPLTALMVGYINSYKDLEFSSSDFPKSVYQFQTKFRAESRAKSGVMRTREFVMKDLYSFCKDEKDHEKFYEKVKNSYRRIFERVGIGDRTYITKASGGSFSEFSYEFQTVCEAGEDTIYIRSLNDEAINVELEDKEGVFGPLSREDYTKATSIEVGNIFTLGTKYSEALGLKVKTEDGNEKPVYMGSYGIGVARLMGTIVEVLSDDKGIVWPEAVAPFGVHLIEIAGGNEDISKKAREMYAAMLDSGIEVLWDDREDARAGEKFADSDLLGIPYRVVVSEKSLASGGFELKHRTKTESEIVTFEELVERLK